MTTAARNARASTDRECGRREGRPPIATITRGPINMADTCSQSIRVYQQKAQCKSHLLAQHPCAKKSTRHGTLRHHAQRSGGRCTPVILALWPLRVALGIAALDRRRGLPVRGASCRVGTRLRGLPVTRICLLLVSGVARVLLRVCRLRSVCACKRHAPPSFTTTCSQRPTVDALRILSQSAREGQVGPRKHKRTP
jgi:hypothetical protein